jgi:hypothetical protein
LTACGGFGKDADKLQLLLNEFKLVHPDAAPPAGFMRASWTTMAGRNSMPPFWKSIAGTKRPG